MLAPERLTAYEVGWSGALTDWLGATAAWYRNDTRGSIDFTDETFWSGADPPAGWIEAATESSQFIAEVGAALPPGTLPPAVEAVGRSPGALIELLAALADVQLPRTLTYVNRELIRNTGVELGLNARRGRYRGYLNYSWQAEPVTEGYSADDIEEIAIPAAHRVNAGIDANFDPVEIGASVNYSDRALFTDVLWFIGWTEPYTMVNASMTLNLMEGRIRPSLRVVNLLNQEIQQHIFGRYPEAPGHRPDPLPVLTRGAARRPRSRPASRAGRRGRNHERPLLSYRSSVSGEALRKRSNQATYRSYRSFWKLGNRMPWLCPG